MNKYCKKPIVIEAFNWTPDDEYNAGRCAAWMQMGGCNFAVAPNHAVTIRTLGGDMDAQPGDWIIKDIKGEFYPCKDDIFQVTYEKVEDD